MEDGLCLWFTEMSQSWIFLVGTRLTRWVLSRRIQGLLNFNGSEVCIVLYALIRALGRGGGMSRGLEYVKSPIRSCFVVVERR